MRNVLDALKTLELTPTEGGANPHLVPRRSLKDSRILKHNLSWIWCVRGSLKEVGRPSERRGRQEQSRGEKMIAKCEECDADVTIPADAIVGEIVQCKERSVEYEVASIDGGKVTLKPAEVAEEDWGE